MIIEPESLFCCPRVSWYKEKQNLKYPDPRPAIYSYIESGIIYQLPIDEIKHIVKTTVVYADSDITPYEESICRAWEAEERGAVLIRYCISTDKIKKHNFELTDTEKMQWLGTIEQRTQYVLSMTELPPIPVTYAPHTSPCKVYDGIFTFKCPYYKECYSANTELDGTAEDELTMQKIKNLVDIIKENEHTQRQAKQERDILLSELFKGRDDATAFIRGSGIKIEQIVKRYDHLNKEKIRRKLGDQYRHCVETKEVKIYEIS